MKDASVVIAGAGGFGQSTIRELLACGARVLAVDAHPGRLEEVAALAGFKESGSVVAQFDLSRPQSAIQLVELALRELGGVDAAVHLVGVNDRRPILEFSDDEWARIIEINLTTAFRFGRAIGKQFTSQGHGSLVYASSVSGLLAHPNHGPYAATKGGLNKLARVMASEWAGVGVTVNAVAPGYTETHLTREHLARSGVRDSLTELVPMGRLGSTEEVASAIAFLLSPRSSYITGHVLYIDGGRTLV